MAKPELDLEHLTHLVIRSRPASMADLRRLTAANDDTERLLLERLTETGTVTQDGDRLLYRSPQQVVTDNLNRLLAQTLESLATTQEQAERLMTDLPTLLEDWTLGTGDQFGPLDVVHGPNAPRDLWMQKLESGQIAHRTLACIPDLSWIEAADFVEQFLSKMAPGGVSTIVSTRDAADPEQRAKIDTFMDAGMEVRCLPDPPSWFGVNGLDNVALPARWGEGWPSSVVEANNETLANVMRCLFQLLWDQGQPLRSVEEEPAWEPLLRLMRRGATQESAARALGIAPRTARRRIADAMEHFHTATLFELGVAYGERRERGRTRAASQPD